MPSFAMLALVLGASMAVGCGKAGPTEKVDAGQRRYCNVSDASCDCRDAQADAVVSSGALDVATPDLSVADLPLSPRLDLAGPEAADVRSAAGFDGTTQGTVDGALDAGDVRGTGGVGGNGGAAGTGGAGGTGGTFGADAKPDAPSDMADGPVADVAPDLGAPDSGDAAPDSADSGDAFAGDVLPDAPDAQSGPDLTPDIAADFPPADAPPLVCSLGGFGWAKQWTPQIASLGTGADGIPWSVGKFYASTDFGTGTPVVYSGTAGVAGKADIFLAKLDPATGLATQAFGIGDPNNSPQEAQGVAVASGGNVGVIGFFSGEIDFTESNSDGSGPSGNVGTAGSDFLQNSSSIPFYGIFGGASAGTYVTPVKEHMVDLGSGALLAVGTHPSQNAFAICGKTSKAVPVWNASGATKGVITGGSATAGGGMDIIVAKIDAATGVPIWGRQFGGIGDQTCESVAIDGNGDVIIAGGYTDTLDFGGSTTAFPVVADASLGLLYVAKLDGATGAASAAHTWGTTGRSDPYSMTVDGNNNVLLAGSLGGNIDFGGGISISDLGLTDAFVVKLTGALAPVWARSFGDAAYDQTAKTVAVSSTGDVFFGGSFKGSLGTLGPPAGGTTATDAFLAQLAGGDGSVVCARAYGDVAGGQQLTTITVARAATGALANAITMGGTFTSQITLGTATLDTGDPGISASYVGRVTP